MRELEGGACFEDAMKEACKAALCSTDFLFTGDVVDSGSGTQRSRISDQALAERLALWLWNSLPDQELVQLATRKQLHVPENLRKQTDRLLSDSRSDRFIADFTDQWLDLWKMDAINQSLANHYGISGVTGSKIRRVGLPEGSPRGSFLTQASVLKVTANGTVTSPVVRGAWINERILGNVIPPPPAGVPAIDPDTRGGEDNPRATGETSRGFSVCGVSFENRSAGFCA
jgi:hypothetical protein